MANKNLWGILGIILIVAVLGVGIYFIIQSPPAQSVLSQSNVYLSDGRAFWVFTASVNNLDEKVTFTKTPTDYEGSDGTKIEPQKGLTISLSKDENSCIYRTTLKEVRGGFLGTQVFKYYILNNPERKALIDIEDGNGRSITIDGTVVDTEVINDPDGKGKVTIQTQGILAGKTDCANYENVALVYKDNNYQVLEKTKYESSIATGTISPSAPINTQFVSSFEDYMVDSTQFVGDLDFGNVVLTLTADQDYFNSIIFTPAQLVEPNIKSIDLPSEIGNDKTASMKVTITNKKDSRGIILVKATSTTATITPSATSVELDNQIILFFSVKNTIQIKDDNEIKIEACSNSQFDGKVCDIETVSYDSVEGNPNQGYCGDNVCQANENHLTCANDCQSPSYCALHPEDPKCPNGKNTCGSWIKLPDVLGGATILPNLFCLINNFFRKFITIFSIIAGFLGGLVATGYTASFMNKQSLKSKWWILLAVFLIIGGLIGYLAYLYFWAIFLSVLALGLLWLFLPIKPSLK